MIPNEGRNGSVFGERRHGPCSLHSVQVFVLAGVMVLSLIIAVAIVGGALVVLLRLISRPIDSPVADSDGVDGAGLTRPLAGNIAT